jgi:hypothetical protein
METFFLTVIIVLFAMHLLAERALSQLWRPWCHEDTASLLRPICFHESFREDKSEYLLLSYQIANHIPAVYTNYGNRVRLCGYHRGIFVDLVLDEERLLRGIRVISVRNSFDFFFPKVKEVDLAGRGRQYVVKLRNCEPFYIRLSDAIKLQYALLH